MKSMKKSLLLFLLAIVVIGIPVLIVSAATDKHSYSFTVDGLQYKRWSFDTNNRPYHSYDFKLSKVQHDGGTYYIEIIREKKGLLGIWGNKLTGSYTKPNTTATYVGSISGKSADGTYRYSVYNKYALRYVGNINIYAKN